MSEILREYKGNCLSEFLSNYAVVDIETTGLSPRFNEIIEIGAIKVVNNDIVDTFSTLIKPDNEIPENIERLTGITNDMVNHDGLDIKTALSNFSKFVGDNIIVGHNANFDVNFLYDNCLKHLNVPFSNDFVDTLKIAQELVKDTYNLKLSTLAKKYDIQNENPHRALNDVLVLNGLYKKLSFVNDHYLEIRMEELSKTLILDESLSYKKISFKSKLRYIEEAVIKNIFKQIKATSYFYLSKDADILVVNDREYAKFQEGIEESEYMYMFDEWKIRAQRRINEGDLEIIKETDFCERLGIPTSPNVKKEIDESSPLYGKVCVFTGTLERMSRTQASSIVEQIGGIVGNGVTAKTNYLILGNNDYCSSIKDGKSSKQKKAEALQLNGKDIQIIPEDVFYELIRE